MCQCRRNRRRLLKNRSSCQQKVTNASQAVDVGATVERIAGCHLRSHVSGRTGGGTLHGQAGVSTVLRLHQAEVEYFREVAIYTQPRQKNIAGLDVTMN